jgi:metallo-beta-lactamase class B
MKWACILALLLTVMPVRAQPSPAPCDACAEWNAPQAPFRIYGNTYYVGSHGLSAILIASDKGHVLIDGALTESAPLIAGNIRALGFRPEDIKLILNSHVHFDHAGGIAALSRLSGAQVAASAWSAAVLRDGKPAADDPQHDIARSVAPVASVRVIRDGETIRAGGLALTARLTPGHTPGGTSWTWSSCEAERCLHIVYADSLTAVSADNYRFTAHPSLLHGFDRSFTILEALPCDILLSPHPGFSGLFEHLKARESGQADALIVPNACRRYVAGLREMLQKRVAQEGAEK